MQQCNSLSSSPMTKVSYEVPLGLKGPHLQFVSIQLSFFFLLFSIRLAARNLSGQEIGMKTVLVCEPSFIIIVQTSEKNIPAF
jgi:hypothetical protein